MFQSNQRLCEDVFAFFLRKKGPTTFPLSPSMSSIILQQICHSKESFQLLLEYLLESLLVKKNTVGLGPFVNLLVEGVHKIPHLLSLVKPSIEYVFLSFFGVSFFLQFLFQRDDFPL